MVADEEQAADWATELVLPHLQRFGEPQGFETIQEALGLGPGDLRAALAALKHDGLVMETDEDYFVAGREEPAAAAPAAPGEEDDDVVEAGVYVEYLVAWPGGSSWVEARNEAEAARLFSATNDAAHLDAGEDVCVVDPSHVVRFTTRLSLVPA